MAFWNLNRWSLAPSTGRHFDVLDGLRGVAILLVVAHHSFGLDPGQNPASRVGAEICAAGWMGVPIFFVLSGFLISLPFFQKRQADPRFWYQRGFAWRRLGKILPPYYLSIGLFLAGYWWLYHDPAYLKSAGMWATGLANFIQLPVLFNMSYWSLMVESHFYILLPLLFWVTRGCGVRRTAAILFVILFTVPMVARLCDWPAGLAALPDVGTPEGRHWEMVFRRFPCQLDYFGWGVGFAGVYVWLAPARERLGGLVVLGYAGAAALLALLLGWGDWALRDNLLMQPTRWSIEVGHFLPAAAALLLLFFMFDADSPGARVLSWGPLRFTGLISYEWFLFHGPVVHWVRNHQAGAAVTPASQAWGVGLALVLTFIFSALAYFCFSLPILRRVRDRLRTDKQ